MYENPLQCTLLKGELINSHKWTQGRHGEGARRLLKRPHRPRGGGGGRQQGVLAEGLDKGSERRLGWVIAGSRLRMGPARERSC
jgi:hypothetical protein